CAAPAAPAPAGGPGPWHLRRPGQPESGSAAEAVRAGVLRRHRSTESRVPVAVSEPDVSRRPGAGGRQQWGRRSRRRAADRPEGQADLPAPPSRLRLPGRGSRQPTPSLPRQRPGARSARPDDCGFRSPLPKRRFLMTTRPGTFRPQVEVLEDRLALSGSHARFVPVFVPNIGLTFESFSLQSAQAALPSRHALTELRPQTLGPLFLTVPDLHDPSAHQNPNTFVGRVAGTDAFLAVVIGGGE